METLSTIFLTTALTAIAWGGTNAVETIGAVIDLLRMIP